MPGARASRPLVSGGLLCVIPTRCWDAAFAALTGCATSLRIAWVFGGPFLALCSLDQTTRFLFAAANPSRPWPKQVRASCGKCPPTTTTHHSQAASETALITRTDRVLLVLLARLVRTWKQALIIVQPDTLLRWHRELFRLYWKRRSKASSHQPKVAAETIALRRRDGDEQSASSVLSAFAGNC